MGRPKSNGCRTCRRRKLKCDRRQPTCNRCEQAGYDCEGFAREYRFVEDPGTKQVMQRTNLPVNLNLSAFEDNICISFLLSDLSFQPLSDTTKSPWLEAHAEGIKSPVAQHSLHALASAYFGRKHRQENLLKHSALLYGRALHNLNEELRDSKKCLSVSVWSSASVLQVYEFLATSAEAGWLAHAGGIGRLVELRGPQRCQTQTELQLFQDNRITIMLDHWKRGKRCFLEKPEWKTVPWALNPESKTPLLRLQDIFCDIPGLIEDVTKLKKLEIEPVERVSFARELAQNILNHLVKLYEWRHKYEEDHPYSCIEVQTTPQPAIEQPLFPTVLQMSTLSCAYGILLYDAALIMLLGFGYAIIGPTFDARMSIYSLPGTTPHGPLKLPGEVLHPQVAATELCRVAEYCLSAYPNSVGLWLISAMKVAYLSFPPTSREAKWLNSRMVAVADLSGFEIGRHQDSQPRAAAPSFER